MALSKYLAAALHDHLTGVASFTAPTNLYVALFDEDGVEVTGGSYARQIVTFGAADVNGVITSTARITFPAATALWGIITQARVYDALTGGNAIFRATSMESRQVDVTDVYIIDVAKITHLFEVF